MPPYTIDSPAKKQSKWSAEEDALIIELRGSGMKWEDISKRLPGRSAISCRLHYQNYLERRSEWDEERKNKLARLYERFKPEMWAKVAEEMQVPWRAAEAMHWQLGEADMARRAGVTPFSLTATAIDATPSGQHHHHQNRSPPHLSYQHQPPQSSHHPPPRGSLRTDPSSAGGGSGSALSPRYGRGAGNTPTPLPSFPLSVTGMGGGRSFSAGPRQGQERSGTPGLGAMGGGPPEPGNSHYLYQQQQQQQQQLPPQQRYQPVGLGLPPIQTGSGPPPVLQQERMASGGALPSFAEITTGVSPYSTPAYSLGASPAPSLSESSGPGAGHSFPAYAMGYGGGGGAGGAEPPVSGGAAGKRRASPNLGPRDQRRRYLQSPQYDDGRGGFHR